VPFTFDKQGDQQGIKRTIQPGESTINIKIWHDDPDSDWDEDSGDSNARDISTAVHDFANRSKQEKSHG
jgi:hypothetical protein